MTRITGPDVVIMYNLKYTQHTHTHTHTHKTHHTYQCFVVDIIDTPLGRPNTSTRSLVRMISTIGPTCAVLCAILDTHI